MLIGSVAVIRHQQAGVIRRFAARAVGPPAGGVIGPGPRQQGRLARRRIRAAPVLQPGVLQRPSEGKP
jgi:hypothetical protein